MQIEITQIFITFYQILEKTSLSNYQILAKKEYSNSKILAVSNKISLFKGPIAENYVASQLITLDKKLYFFKKNKSLEIDFLLHNENGIVPIEVKAGLNTKSKNLHKYIDEFKPALSIRISAKDFGFDNSLNIKFVPLYAIFCIK